jgi:hypothetical protein
MTSPRCLCIRPYLPICLFFVKTFKRSPRCMSVCVPLFFRFMRLMRSPCCVSLSLSLLGKGLSVCVTPPLIFFVFYVVRVVSKENRRLVLPQNFLINNIVHKEQLSPRTVKSFIKQSFSRKIILLRSLSLITITRNVS